MLPRSPSSARCSFVATTQLVSTSFRSRCQSSWIMLSSILPCSYSLPREKRVKCSDKCDNVDGDEEPELPCLEHGSPSYAANICVQYGPSGPSTYPTPINVNSQSSMFRRCPS